ncbi:MAG: SGNH/GDSL hydrolase family protein [Eubacteriales bacterium]
MPIEKRVTQTAESLRRLRLRTPSSAKQLTATLKEGRRSCSIFVLGDSVSAGVTKWPALFAQKLAAKFPAYNVKYADYVNASNKYGAWQDLVTGAGSERHVAISPGIAPQLTKAEIPMTSADLDIEVRFSLDVWNQATVRIICGRTGGNAGTICWYIWLGADGIFHLSWTTDGTTLVTARFNNAGFSANTAGAAYWYRFTLDVNDGAGHYVSKMYTSADGVTWTTFQTITGAAITSVFDHATQAYIIGGTGVSTSIVGKFYEIRINNGIDGPNICPQPIESWKQTASDASYGGHVGGAPIIYVYNGAISGVGITTYDAALLSKVIKRCFDPLIIVALGHNDSGFLMGEAYYTALASLLTEIKKLNSQPMLCFLTENPKTAPAEFITSHSKRISQQCSFALNNNQDVIDAFTEFNIDSRGLAVLVNPVDGIHPTAAGTQLLVDVLWQYFNILNL